LVHHHFEKTVCLSTHSQVPAHFNLKVTKLYHMLISHSYNLTRMGCFSLIRSNHVQKVVVLKSGLKNELPPHGVKAKVDAYIEVR